MVKQLSLSEASVGPPKGTSGTGATWWLCPSCGRYFRPYGGAEGYQKYCSTQCSHEVQDSDTRETGRDALGRQGVVDRDEALERVRRDEFQEKALAVIESLIPGDEVTGEDIRLTCEARGIEPHHHNAWGALVMYAVRKGYLSHTGRYEPMKVSRSHARRTPVYVVLEGSDD